MHATAQAWFTCTLSNPNAAGALPWSGSAATLYGLIEVTAAYTPTSAEVFTAELSGSVAR